MGTRTVISDSRVWEPILQAPKTEEWQKWHVIIAQKVMIKIMLSSVMSSTQYVSA